MLYIFSVKHAKTFGITSQKMKAITLKYNQLESPMPNDVVCSISYNKINKIILYFNKQISSKSILYFNAVIFMNFKINGKTECSFSDSSLSRFPLISMKKKIHRSLWSTML